MNLVSLAAEVSTDPAGLGYAALVAAGDHEGLAELVMAAPVVGVVSEIPRAKLVLAGLAGTAADREKIAFVLASGVPLDGRDATTKAILAALGLDTKEVKEGTTTRAELLGLGLVTASDVADALKV